MPNSSSLRTGRDQLTKLKWIQTQLDPVRCSRHALSPSFYLLPYIPLLALFSGIVFLLETMALRNHTEHGSYLSYLEGHLLSPSFYISFPKGLWQAMFGLEAHQGTSLSSGPFHRRGNRTINLRALPGNAWIWGGGGQYQKEGVPSGSTNNRVSQHQLQRQRGTMGSSGTKLNEMSAHVGRGGGRYNMKGISGITGW